VLNVAVERWFAYTRDMTPQEFKATWSRESGNERQTYQEHFRDLCALLHQPTPSAANRSDLDYTFERAVTTAIGAQGFADVWKRGFFGWEYKGDKKNLDAAYTQLLSYKDALENPPLLVVSDTKLIRIHTNFTNRAKVTHEIPLSRIDEPDNLATLTLLFTQPELLEPERTIDDVTKEAAIRFGKIATGLQARGEEPHETAHFLVQVLFCLFAEDVTILPRGLVSEMLAFTAKRPDQFLEAVGQLLAAMESGGFVNYQEIPRVNGGLFREIKPLQLEPGEIATLAEAAKLDWSSVEPAIFGTLFERSLDPSSRAKLGAHYTGKADILRVVEPVVMTPLRRRWDEVRAQADQLKAAWEGTARGKKRDDARAAFARLLFGFREELARVRILDPACGSGNFLYVALERLLELDKEVTGYAVANGLSGMLPVITTDQLLGLEINEYARELAQVVIWIGYLQWMIRNGYGYPVPVLSPLETIRLQDALLDLRDPAHPKEAEWPAADFIIGNPPFLGGNRVRQELGDEYLGDLFEVYDGRVPRFADLCCYFFEKARAQIASDGSERAGLLATNSIRGGANREVLKRIKESGDIYMAWSDEPWIIDGAAVRISIVGFDDGSEIERFLNGARTSAVNPDLTSSVDVVTASVLTENLGIGFMGQSKKGPFDIPATLAREWMTLPVNPNGRPNSDVLRPIANGLDITRRPRDMWIIDFGVDMPEDQAALYEAPFEYALRYVFPVRVENNRAAYRERWWIHAEPRPALRAALAPLLRYVATPTVAKHRLFVWLDHQVVPDQQLIAFARDDDYFFGVLHSRAHEVWSLRMGTWLGVGNDPRYTPTTCFETFPLPWPPGREPVDDPRVVAIGAAARELDETRNNWLNPPDASEADLKKRTLTNLYNQRPTWLADLHARLDRAVWAAYGWDGEPWETTEEEILTRLLALNGERASR
jgi:type II restriction/modification system DNA methylase subunit YeeA